jgi:leader peptidase (prepilin peptidase)/N-methyltransferase
MQHVLTTAMITAFAVAIGVVGCPQLTGRGLRQISRDDAWSGTARSVAVVAGLIAGAVGAQAARQAGSWWYLPALLVWALTLAAAATCDGLTQRIPTPLVRQGGAVTALLVLVAASLAGDWRGLLLAGLASAAAGLILAACWKFAGAGFGDVRLAALGGLGLGHTSPRALLWALVAFTLIVAAQAIWTLARGGNRHTLFAYGPALAIGFGLAGTL